MLEEQAISLLTQVKEIILGSESWLDSTHQPIEEAFSMAIEAIKSTQTNAPNVLNALDCISRQAAIDAIENTDWYHQNKNKDMVHGANSSEHQAWYKAEDVYKALKNVPSTQPEQKKGKWIEIDDDLISGRCSQCGWEAHLYEDDVFGMDYCPNCGAKMEDENE